MGAEFLILAAKVALRLTQFGGVIHEDSVTFCQSGPHEAHEAGAKDLSNSANASDFLESTALKRMDLLLFMRREERFPTCN